jgi:tetratricopeptide (TPR) repeat protein
MKKTMKQIQKKQLTSIFLRLSVILLISFAGCEKVLDQKPVNEVDEEFAISDIKGAQAAVAGLYNQLQDQSYYGRNFQIMSDVATDQAQSIGTWDFYREMDTYQISTGNTENGNFYGRAYKAIFVANTILSKVPAINGISEEQKSVMQGHAYFVRGLAYFDLTRTFGGVPNVVGTLGMPLVLTATPGLIEYPSRSTLQESYDLVISDLLKALEMLPETNVRSQASKGAARALLSRAYLYLNQNDQVIKYATDVINDVTRYSLLPNYAEIFSSKLTSESVFELTYNTADQSGIRTWYYPTSAGGRGDLASHNSFVTKARADVNDVRGTLFALASANVFYPTKFGRTAGNIDNIPVLRIAEMYLNRAEAVAKIGADLPGALADLNRVRTRSRAAALNLAGQQEILKAIWNEQQLEFAYEGHSLFDLTRTGQAVVELVELPRLNAPTSITLTDIKRTLFPMPLFEVNANPNILQNEVFR